MLLKRNKFDGVNQNQFMTLESFNNTSQGSDFEVSEYAARYENFAPRIPALFSFSIYDLNQRNKSWLREELYRRMDESGFELSDILLDRPRELVENYLPRRGRLVSQEEVALRLYGDPRTSGFKATLRHALFRVDGRYYLGPQAIEVLKPDNFFYRFLLKEELYTVDQVLDLEDKSEQVIRMFKRRFIFEEVQRLLSDGGFDFNPHLEDLKFPEELPPS